MTALLSLLRQLPRSCRLLIWLGFALSAVSALIEVLTLAAAVPFLEELAGKTGALSEAQLPNAGGKFALLIVIASLFRLASVWWSSHVAAQVGHQLATRVVHRYLCLPYASFLVQRSSQISATATQHCSAVAFAYRNLLQLIQAALVSIALAAALMILQPVVAGSVLLGLGLVYGLLLSVNRRLFDRWGEVGAQAVTDQLQAIQEALGAIRDIQLDSAQASSVRHFSAADRRYRRCTSWIEVLAAAPRYVLEAVLLLVIILLAIVLALVNPEGSADLIAILGAFALGGQRLIPSLQQCYASIGSLRSSQSALQSVAQVLELQPAPEFVGLPGPWDSVSLLSTDPLHHQVMQLRFARISYRYPGAAHPVLVDFSLQLNPGECLGIIGPTGSGKSTLLDIIMGLLIPQSGSVWLDDGQIEATSPEAAKLLRSWRRSLAHVPQQVFIADCTLLENIAFGIPPAEIDFHRVCQAASAAQLDGLIASLPKGYQTSVGERGAFLSGGQRQRLGLARAFYKGASLLILDEATSALDSETEAAVLDAIDSIRKQRHITVVMVSHRLATLERCDRILALHPAPLPAQEFRRPYPPGLLV